MKSCSLCYGMKFFFVLLTMPLEHIDVSYQWLLDVNHMIIVTYSFRGSLLSPYRPLFSISSKGSFICTFPQTKQHIHLMDQLWTIGWNGKYPKLQMHPLCRMDRMIQTFTGTYASWPELRPTLYPQSSHCLVFGITRIGQ